MQSPCHMKKVISWLPFSRDPLLGNLLATQDRGRPLMEWIRSIANLEVSCENIAERYRPSTSWTVCA